MPDSSHRPDTIATLPEDADESPVDLAVEVVEAVVGERRPPPAGPHSDASISAGSCSHPSAVMTENACR
jgi:hypothetical protein